jgi:hypothetical protein
LTVRSPSTASGAAANTAKPTNAHPQTHIQKPPKRPTVGCDYDVFDGGFDLTRIVLGATFRHDSLQRPHEPKSYRAGISSCRGDRRSTGRPRQAVGCHAPFSPRERDPSVSRARSPRWGPRLLTLVFHSSDNGKRVCSRVRGQANKPPRPSSTKLRMTAVSLFSRQTRD